jgi:predicted DNA-binding WGR domain protein
MRLDGYVLSLQSGPDPTYQRHNDTERSTTMSAPDFRNEDPVWVRYAEYTGGGSDKFYEVRIDMDEAGAFWLTKRWGRRPDAGGGQTKPEQYQSLSSAQNAGLTMFGIKLGKGYREVERPWGAGQRVRRESGPDYYAEDTEAF